MTEELFAAIDRAVADLLAAAGVTEPPIDAVTLATDFLALPPRPPDPDSTPERRHWQAARTIARSLRERITARLDLEGANVPLDAIAARLLLPTPWFVRDNAACRRDLAVLRGRYATRRSLETRSASR